MARAAISERAAERIRKALENEGRTQEWLSEQTGIPMRTLARRLHKTHPSSMSLDELGDIAEALGVGIADLIAPVASDAMAAAS